MKRLVPLLWILAICFSLCACGASASRANIDECKELIGNIGDIDTAGIVSSQGEILHSNRGINAYEAAKTKYESLSDKEKEQVDNAYILDEKENDYETAKALRSQLAVERDVLLECKDTVVEKIKKSLKDPSSYVEVDWSVLVDHDILDTGSGNITVDITYSATNSFGGRLQEDTLAFIDGTYINNEFSIKKITFF